MTFGKELATSRTCKSVNKGINESLFLKPINQNELVEMINTLKVEPSLDEDNIKSNILKQSHIYLIKPLLYLINLILKKGINPDIKKKYGDRTIFFTDDRLDKVNYRLIAVSSVENRLFEKCIEGF